MNATSRNSPDRLIDNLAGMLPALESAYKDIHAHPELSMQEHRTAAIAAKHLQNNGYEVVTGVGATGVVGVLRNGEGPTVMLRADMDALPIREATDLDYASTATAKDANGNPVPVAHACGHDMHVAWLMGVAALFSKQRDAWRGTLVTVFQPGEETAQGARAMIADGLLNRFPKPDVVLGQHVMVGPSGTIAGSAGPITSAADSLQIRLFGRGAHGSMPQASVDPIVMAAAVVLRLQTIVAREIGASRKQVIELARSIGFDAIDSGPLKNARLPPGTQSPVDGTCGTLPVACACHWLGSSNGLYNVGAQRCPGRTTDGE